MADGYEILDVDAGNVDRLGFFCYMSKPKAPGYRYKRDWLAARFAEGLRIKMLHETGGRTVGFIETRKYLLLSGYGCVVSAGRSLRYTCPMMASHTVPATVWPRPGISCTNPVCSAGRMSGVTAIGSPSTPHSFDAGRKRNG